MAFKLPSDDLKDGGQLPEAQVFNGMGHRGGNISPHLAVGRCPRRHQEFCRDAVRPGCPDRLGLVALGGREHSGFIAQSLPRGAGSGKGGLAARRGAGAQRLRQQ